MKNLIIYLLFLPVIAKSQTTVDAIGPFKIGKSTKDIIPALVKKCGTAKLISSNAELDKCQPGKLYIVKKKVMLAELINDVCPEVTTYYLPTYTVGNVTLKTLALEFYKDSLVYISSKNSVAEVDSLIKPIFGAGKVDNRPGVDACMDSTGQEVKKEVYRTKVTYRDDIIKCTVLENSYYTDACEQKVAKVFILRNIMVKDVINDCNTAAFKEIRAKEGY